MNNKQLLQQYVDTGVELPEYQIRILPDDLLKTYLRKRLIATENSYTGLADYELELITPDQRFQYWMKRVEREDKEEDLGDGITNEQFKSLTPDQRFQYAMKRVKNIFGISDKQFELLTPRQRFLYLMKRVEKGGGISNEQFKLLSPDKQKIIRDYEYRKHIWSKNINYYGKRWWYFK